MAIDKIAVGNRINSIRENLGLSMTEFGERIDGVAKSGTINNWVKGKNLPNNKRLKRIAELGNISVDELLQGKQEQTINPFDLFKGPNNIRQHLYVGLSDEEVDELAQDLEMLPEEINYIFSKARIYVDMTNLPEKITI